MANSKQSTHKINKHIFVWVGSFLFAGIGLDRFLRGQTAIGVCKLIFGWLTFGIWALVDFIIAVTKAYGVSGSNSNEIEFDSEGNYLN